MKTVLRIIANALIKPKLISLFPSQSHCAYCIIANAMNIDELSELVVMARKEQRLSQKDLAELAGVGATVIYKIEHGDPGVTLTSFVSVLTALGFDLRCQSPLGGEVSLGR